MPTQGAKHWHHYLLQVHKDCGLVKVKDPRFLSLLLVCELPIAQNTLLSLERVILGPSPSCGLSTSIHPRDLGGHDPTFGTRTESLPPEHMWLSLSSKGKVSLLPNELDVAWAFQALWSSMWTPNQVWSTEVIVPRTSYLWLPVVEETDCTIDWPFIYAILDRQVPSYPRVLKCHPYHHEDIS